MAATRPQCAFPFSTKALNETINKTDKPKEQPKNNEKPSSAQATALNIGRRQEAS